MIEIDIKPYFDATKYEVFSIKRKDDKKRRDKNFDGGDLYIRQGTITQEVADKDREGFCDVVTFNAKERHRQELKLMNLQSGSYNIDICLNRLICRGFTKMNDNEHQYILIVDQMDEVSVFDHEWISKIRCVLLIKLKVFGIKTLENILWICSHKTQIVRFTI